jgi:hypothetical protein
MSFFCLWSDSSFFGVSLVFKTKEQMLPMEMKMMLQMEEQKECKQMLPMACKVHQQMEVSSIHHMLVFRFLHIVGQPIVYVSVFFWLFVPHSVNDLILFLLCFFGVQSSSYCE